MRIEQFLQPEHVVLSLHSDSKKRMLKELSALAAEATGIHERVIYAALAERETLGCTAMGEGVCIPHARIPGIRHMHAVFARLDQRIDFNSADGQKVDLIFMLLTPESSDAEHVKALSAVSKVLRKAGKREAMRSAKTAEEIFALLTHDASDDPVAAA